MALRIMLVDVETVSEQTLVRSRINNAKLALLVDVVQGLEYGASVDTVAVVQFLEQLLQLAQVVCLIRASFPLVNISPVKVQD